MKQITSKEQVDLLVSIYAGYPRTYPVSTRKTSNTPCGDCEHARSNAYTHHIACVNPPIAVDGCEHGIKNGWFAFPLNYDPIWMCSDCGNFTPITKDGEDV